MNAHNEKLVRMAKQIADFFRSYPQEQAVAGVQEHIHAFWSPAMRRDLHACIAEGAIEIDPLVLAAAERLAQGRSPAKKEKAGPDQVGAIDASDAG